MISHYLFRVKEGSWRGYSNKFYETSSPRFPNYHYTHTTKEYWGSPIPLLYQLCREDATLKYTWVPSIKSESDQSQENSEMSREVIFLPPCTTTWTFKRNNRRKRRSMSRESSSKAWLAYYRFLKKVVF